MLGLPIQQKIFAAVHPVDFRKGIDGLCGIVRERFSKNPMDGTIFVFRNRMGNTLKILFYDGGGFWLCQKRFSRGRIRFWPEAEHSHNASMHTQKTVELAGVHKIYAPELTLLIHQMKKNQAVSYKPFFIPQQNKA